MKNTGRGFCTFPLRPPPVHSILIHPPSKLRLCKSPKSAVPHLAEPNLALRYSRKALQRVVITLAFSPWLYQDSPVGHEFRVSHCSSTSRMSSLNCTPGNAALVSERGRCLSHRLGPACILSCHYKDVSPSAIPIVCMTLDMVRYAVDFS